MNINSTGQLSASLEDYLEAICWIASEKGAARTKDIAQRIGVKAGSVTGALQLLTRAGFVNYAPYEAVTLTKKGHKKAKQVIRKHMILKDFFARVLGVDENAANDGACKMEHAISNELLERLERFMKTVRECPHRGNGLAEK